MLQEPTFYALPTGIRLNTVHIVASSITTSSRTRQHLIAVAALLLLCAMLCGYALLVEPYTQWDARLSNWLNTQRSLATDQLMLSITMMADLLLSTALILGFVIGLMIYKHWWLSVYLLCTFFSTTLSVAIIKSVTQRTRPALSDSTLSLMSFPSGHAARAFLVFGILALLLSWGRCAQTKKVALLIASVLSALVAISRVYLGVHWASDVLAGAALAGIMLIGIDWQLTVHSEQPIIFPIKRVLAAVFAGYIVYYLYFVKAQSLIYGITNINGTV